MCQISINNYIFDKPLCCDNSGFSKWGIGRRGGCSYFVKEFLSPTYPVDDDVYDEKRRADKIQYCDRFVQNKIDLYNAVRRASNGILVTPEQFFRVGAKYYMSTKAIIDPAISVDEISKRPFDDVLKLCCSIAYGISELHAQHVIHADIKPDNIIVTSVGDVIVPLKIGDLHAKIIDFDCSFFEGEGPKLGEELNGDMVYLSPEGYLHIAGIESNLSCKMDVFALGLLFHEYLTGYLPGFDTKEYQYAYESVLDDKPLDVSKVKNTICQDVISKMLSKSPDDRPSMKEVFDELDILLLKNLNHKPAEKKKDIKAEKSSKSPKVKKKSEMPVRSSDASDFLFRPEDL